MQIVKPNSLGLSFRPIEYRKRFGLCISGYLHLPMDQGEAGRLWSEASMWNLITQEMAVPLIDEGVFSEAELLKYQRHVESLINSTQGIVWESPLGSLEFSYVSKEAERMLGYPSSRWLTEPGFWRNLIHPDDRAAVSS